MADFSFSDDAELQKLNAQVLDDPEEFEHWEKLVRAAESQEGGLHRNSSPGAIASTREVYDKFLARFPLFFGYWKKYADLEFSIAGTEAAEMVYERGVASIGTSVDLWANYCGFKVETSHDPDVIRELFDRGAESVGLDFLAHPFWDKYIEYEERIEAQDRIFAILGRIIRIPMHQYARYFEKFRSMTVSFPVADLAPGDIVAQIHNNIVRESGQKGKSEQELEAELRAKLDEYHLEVFKQTQTETTKRWTYESEIKRPYFHVTELDDQQLSNWRKYLDFEEAQNDYQRIKFLYERCLVTAANYEEFWMRYARWMLAQSDKAEQTRSSPSSDKSEEVRNIYQRASWVYVPIYRPTVRLYYAQFEESAGRPDVAIAIHEAILMNMTTHVESIVSLANLYRRQHGLESAVNVLKGYIDSQELGSSVKGALVSEWARMVWRVSGQVDEARSIYEQNQQNLLDSHEFWTNFLQFELDQPLSAAGESANHKRIKAVYDSVRQSPGLSPASIRQLSFLYFLYLKERGDKKAMNEFMKLDLEVNGPASVCSGTKDDNKEGGLQNGSAGPGMGANAYSRYSA